MAGARTKSATPAVGRRCWLLIGAAHRHWLSKAPTNDFKRPAAWLAAQGKTVQQAAARRETSQVARVQSGGPGVDGWRVVCSLVWPREGADRQRPPWTPGRRRPQGRGHHTACRVPRRGLHRRGPRCEFHALACSAHFSHLHVPGSHAHLAPVWHAQTVGAQWGQPEAAMRALAPPGQPVQVHSPVGVGVRGPAGR
jgi:hypothetical protein